MTYDTAAKEPIVLDGTELKLGDAVIIARRPEVANIRDDGLWRSAMLPCVGKAGVVGCIGHQHEEDIRVHGSPLVLVRFDGEPSWWFRLSELSRPQHAQPATP